MNNSSNLKFNIYVINLDKDTQRLEEMKEKLSPNIFTRIQAIYGNTDDLNIFKDICFTSRFLTPKSVLATGLSHKKAVEKYLSDISLNDEPEFALILEDDATPVSNQYIKEIETAVIEAPSDWEIIKLDYLPKTNFRVYNKIPTTLFTAYLINRKGALKYVKTHICYHADLDVWFKNIIIYNNPYIIFNQKWENNNGSNNQLYSIYNPLSRIFYISNYKALRLFDIEYTIADLILYLVIFMIFIKFIYYSKKINISSITSSRFTLLKI